MCPAKHSRLGLHHARLVWAHCQQHSCTREQSSHTCSSSCWRSCTKLASHRQVHTATVSSPYDDACCPLPPSLSLSPSPPQPNRTTSENHTGCGPTQKCDTHRQNRSADQPRPGNNGLERSSLSTRPLPRAFHIPETEIVRCQKVYAALQPTPPHTPCLPPPMYTHVTAAHPAAELLGGRESAAPSCCTHCCHTGKADASQKRHQCGSAKWQAAVHSNQAPAPCPTGTGRVKTTHTRARVNPQTTTSQPAGSMAWHVVPQGMAQVLVGGALTQLMPMNRRATGNRR